MYFSNENHCTITQVLTTMDKIDDLITATVVTSSLQPGGAPKCALHSSNKSALKLAKSTLNKYYSRTDDSNIYRIAMGELTHFCSILADLKLSSSSQLQTRVLSRPKMGKGLDRDSGRSCS